MAILPERFGVRLHTYVLMPNHYHLQIETPRLNLSEAIRWLNISYAAASVCAKSVRLSADFSILQ